MKVLLIQPPFEDFFATPIRLYPLGLLYAARVFQTAGWQVEILDCLAPLRKRRIAVPPEMSYLEPFLKSPLFFKGYHRFGLDQSEIVRRIRDSSPDLIGISSQFTAYFSNVAALARRIKGELGLPIVVGGHHATSFPGEIKQRAPDIDQVLIGPAEECLPRFLAERGASAAKEPLDWRTIEPARDLIPADRYKIGRANAVSMIASRGCPFRCEFCSVHSMFGREILYRSADAVLAEMRRARVEAGAGIFNFEDDNLSFDRTWFREFLSRVAEDSALRGIELTAMNGLCSTTLDEDLLPLMAAAGFRRLNLSLVTRSGEIRGLYRRPSEKAGFERLVRSARRQKLFVTVYIIIGLPGQTEGEIRNSMDYLWDLGVLVGPSVFYIPPGSPLFGRLDLPPALRDAWLLYRSSAFAVETAELSRAMLIDLFLYARRKNLDKKAEIG